MRAALLALVLAGLGVSTALVAGCPKPDTCSAGFVGDPAKAPEIEPVFANPGPGDATLTTAPLEEGAVVPLSPPPQGGFVFYVGARVRNMDLCVEFQGRMRDRATGELRAMDGRSTTLVKQADGWAAPRTDYIGHFANVNACPAYYPEDVHRVPYTLELTVVDRSGRRASVTRTIVPACQLADRAVQGECVCTCTGNYMLGKCGADGGLRSVDAATDGP